MNLSALIAILKQSSEYQALLTRLNEVVKPSARRTDKPAVQLNLLGAARPYLIAALQQELRHPILIVTAKPDHALNLHRQLSAWSGAPADVLHFAEAENLPFERAGMSPDARQKRLTALHRLASWDTAHSPSFVVVASARALMQQSLAPQRFREATLVIRRDETRPLKALLTHWQNIGYEPATLVEASGQFSHRGGIVDVWSPTADAPVRIEFFGDEIDSIRRFDLLSQRSREPLGSLVLTPASEALPGFGAEAFSHLQKIVESGDDLNDGAQRDFAEDLQDLSDGNRFNHIEFYLPYLEKAPHTLLDYLPEGSLVVADDWQAVLAAADEWMQEVKRLKEDAVARKEIPKAFTAPVVNIFGQTDDGKRKADRLSPAVRFPPHLDFTFGLGEDAFDRWVELFDTAPRYGGKLHNAIDDWLERINAGEQVVVISRQAERIRELLQERNFIAELSDTARDSGFTLMPGVLAEGFAFNPLSAAPASPTDEDKTIPRLLILCDAEIFGYARAEPRRPSEKRATPMESYYADLAVGAHVVHVEHGIARYGGLTRRDFSDSRVEREYLQLEYAGGDKLFVPIDQADRVARYVGGGEHAPPIHRLGTTDWETAKAKATRAVEDIAEELMQLYAKRAHVHGHAFGDDTNWQKELEDSFAYVETPDQLRALAAIKRDMELDRPMDRLICGDVGYGKTEVALRAAFKAVMDGKQVAVLVPTTVLAEQHLKTFEERLKAFPVAVEMLSRFRTEAQQNKILEKLVLGGVDIVIGTHRLLQDDVLFKDLGLLIIDEEQRFGVKAKEKLKQMRTEVDVLTLTATPIPRTLNMALMGARDMSTIDTPPEERLPIRTYVTQYDEAAIKQAILREIGRGGQVFFVHNRVEGIEQMAARIRRIAPEARVAIGHGQMPERELERVMIEFGEGKYDVLVCTTIIESGIDLPNVNTIVVNRADQFGLADLYQLRGRVGRSARQAYAYLMYSRDKVLVDVARKRLQAIFEASELGAGFKIAMRDLEIRGAGDILGAKQHGHIAAIGFDLYTKLLAQAIREKKSLVQPAQTAPEPEAAPSSPLTTQPPLMLDLPLTAHLPGNYVPDEELRLRLYRRIAEMDHVQAIEEFGQELADRFGAVPAPAQNLLYLLRLKTLGLRANVESIMADADRIIVKVRDRLILLEWRPPRDIERQVAIGRNTVTLPMDGDWMASLERLLQSLAETRA